MRLQRRAPFDGSTSQALAGTGCSAHTKSSKRKINDFKQHDVHAHLRYHLHGGCRSLMNEDLLKAIFIGVGLAAGGILLAIAIYFAFVHPHVEECRSVGGTVLGGKCVDVKEIRL